MQQLFLYSSWHYALLISIIFIFLSLQATGQNQPSANPTAKPTPSPTTTPSSYKPTASPTASPTAKPTPSPTASPSYTFKPTSSPKPSPNPTFAPSPRPTMAPTYSQMPTPNPTVKPTPKPTSSPTPKPTSKPTAIDVYNVPQLTVPSVFTFQLNYFCHPLHYRSGLNVFQTVFETMVVNSPAPLHKAIVSISPFNDEIDQLGMISNDFSNTVLVTYKSGTLTIEQENSDLSTETSTNWNTLLSSVAYRLGIEGGRLRSCYLYTEGRLPARTISIYVVDMYGRVSNTISVALLIETATLMYSDDVSTTTSNIITMSSLLEPSDSFAVNMTYLMTEAVDKR